MTSCQQEDLVRNQIDRLNSNVDVMLQHIDEGTQKIEQFKGKITTQNHKDSRLEILGDISLVQNEPLIMRIDNQYYLECVLCGFENPLDSSFPTELICQYCTEKYNRQEPTQVLEEAKEDVFQEKETKLARACINLECGNTDQKYFDYSNRNEIICRKCGKVQPPYQLS